MIVDSVDSRPLIDEISPMTELRKEYENGSTSFVAQIDWLTSQGFDSIRRARGMRSSEYVTKSRIDDSRGWQLLLQMYYFHVLIYRC